MVETIKRNTKGRFVSGSKNPWNKGKKMPVGFSEKQRKIKKGNTNVLGKRWTVKDSSKMGKFWKGKKRAPFSEEHIEALRKRMSECQFGPNNPSWHGGVSYKGYTSDWTEVLKESIRERDNYICQECGVHQDELSQRLDTHHIDYNKDNCDPNNLIALCRTCHVKTNFNREEWREYFNKRNI